MVLILSNSEDISTNEVIEWLNFYNLKWFRINNSDTVNISFNKSDISIEVKNEKIYLSEIKSYWYRRGYINYSNFILDSKSEISEFINEENYSLRNYFYYLLSKIKHLNSLSYSSVNKLIATHKAKEIGINTPNSHILQNKHELFTLQNKIITKTLSGNPSLKIQNKVGILYTSEINNLENLPDNFMPSLIQEYIEKKYELRIFYINEVFYSMAIFSQNDSKTQIDFRRYNSQKPNRTVPYNLPKHLKIKLVELMNQLNLNCGSIDMIVSPENEYYFLEVNPVGQFGMVSYPCNYNLEKIIAKYLSY